MLLKVCCPTCITLLSYYPDCLRLFSLMAGSRLAAHLIRKAESRCFTLSAYQFSLQSFTYTIPDLL
jgi:hypothetical protein